MGTVYRPPQYDVDASQQTYLVQKLRPVRDPRTMPKVVGGPDWSPAASRVGKAFRIAAPNGATVRAGAALDSREVAVLARDALVDLFLRLLRGAHDGADHGDVESNGDGSPDARGDVRTDARHGGAVLRADDGHLCAIGRADGHGAALAFGSADGRADDGADAADSLNGGDDDIRARRRRGPPPPHPSPAHNSTHYISRAFMLAAGKTLAIFAAHTLQSARGAALGHMQAKRWTGQP